MSERALGSVELLPSTVDALSTLDICYVGRVNVNLEAMAWLVLVLRHLPDSDRRFPHGKWATIQHIEQQLDSAASARAAEITGEAGE